VRPALHGTVDTGNGGGDCIGHSTYHAALVKFNKRLGKFPAPGAGYQVGDRSFQGG
jgi:hypothetical protein